MELIIGLIGMALILLAFMLNEFDLWKAHSKHYHLTNMIGSILLLIYSFIIESWPFLILNAVWLIVSIRDSLKKSSEKAPA